MDPNSAPTGNTGFILSEIYKTDAGVADHFPMAKSSWPEFRTSSSGWRNARSRDCRWL
jgi:hypothetical protein